MIRKLLFACVFAMLAASVSWAQSRQVTGRVTDKETGEGIPGVTVMEKGTTNGVGTDFDGKFSIKVMGSSAVLVFNSVGYAPQEVEVGNRTVINLQMAENVTELESVVVTALGISREKASLGYAVQEVSAAELNNAQEGNVLNALSGKVAGVQVSSGSGLMGGSSRVLIRGASSVVGNNQPLYIVDGVPLDNSDFTSREAARGGGGYDYGTLGADINPDDVASVNVLKGAAASALYGSRASNGVIMITTKRGRPGKKGLGVSVNSSVSFERVNILPDLQDEYGGGHGDFKTVTVNGKDYKVVAYGVDESWGPKFDPNVQVVHWDGWDDPNNPVTRPWVAPANDIDEFFETGVTFKNSISLTGADDKGSFRLSYTNVDGSGYMPNSEIDKNILGFSAERKLHDRVTATANITYLKNDVLGRPITGYDRGVMQQMLQWGQRQLDYGRLKNYKNSDGTHRTWNRKAYNDPRPKFVNNPYWNRHENYQNDVRDRYYGGLGLKVEIIEGLSASGKIYMDAYSFRIQERLAVGSFEQSEYNEIHRQSRQFNYEFVLNYDKHLNEDFHLLANAGTNLRTEWYKRMTGETSGGLILPNEYYLTNSIQPAVVHTLEREKKVQSVFGLASIGWRNMVFLEGTLRNDWFSTLPNDNNSYLYGSGTLSVVLSEIPALQELSWLTHAKFRSNIGVVGNDTDPYNTMDTYENVDDKGVDFSIDPDKRNPNLKPEKTHSWELGLEASFFDSRLSFDFTYYNTRTKDLLTSIDVSGGTGYNSVWLNAGEMSNKGVELVLSGDILRLDDLTWNASLNFASNENELLELSEGINNYRLVNSPFEASVNARVGQVYGAIMGTDFIYDSQGNKVIDSKGHYMQTDNPVVLGSVTPDYILGLNNQISYKGFTLGALLEIQHGGNYYSISHMWGMYSGILEETAANGIRENGIVLDGVQGKVTYNDDGSYTVTETKKNTVRIDAETYGKNFYHGAEAHNIFDADYIKLKELSLRYNFPAKWIGPLQSVKVSVFGRNLGIWGLDNDNIDPEMVVQSG
ncbi:MAG: SusC/RagA family TonB-linked outer membrane protein, partial [Cytophagales bacterium]|nr:SusC/RagA family TonB-linked outer membrane protein [Cytophagales bacterium]